MARSDINSVIKQLEDADNRTLDQLVPALYRELRSVAHRRLKKGANRHSLNTTGLVHEAYLRLVETAGVSFDGRDHFLAVASRVMRNVLVDRARARMSAKRGGGVPLAELEEETWVAEVDLDRVAELDEALGRLERLDERQGRMIEQRYFGGLSLDEIAEAMHVSLATVKRDLRFARAWLAAELTRDDR
jgi:RNA polymerase sigma factor (TIGR02999 family)